MLSSGFWGHKTFRNLVFSSKFRDINVNLKGTLKYMNCLVGLRGNSLMADGLKSMGSQTSPFGYIGLITVGPGNHLYLLSGYARHFSN